MNFAISIILVNKWLVERDQGKRDVLCKEWNFQSLTLLASNCVQCKVLWIATRISASTLAISIIPNGTEYKLGATSGAVAAEVLADICGSHQ
jgi:hypothetical protein